MLDQRLRGVVGARTATVLEEQLEIHSVGDLLRYYPRRYMVRGELTNIEELNVDEEVTILAEIENVKLRRIPGRKGSILDVVVTDGRAKLALAFFNQPWRERDLVIGRRGLFAGKVGEFKGKRQLAHPDFIIIPEGDDEKAAASEFAGKYIPVYPATSKLPSWKIAQCVDLALDSVVEIPEPLPEEVLEKLEYPTLLDAFRNVHHPTDLESAESARQRLTFDEALTMQLFLVRRRNEIREEFTRSREIKERGMLAKFDSRLPFQLTRGQENVWREIKEDLSRSHPMYRLLQGDVGSGKTIIALRAMLAIVDSGGQAALLAPTEVLAQQHYANFIRLLGDLAQGGMLGGDVLGTQVSLLTGSVVGTERTARLNVINSGEAGIVVGTHALLSEGVEFKDLALIVVDEQHRFGVEQRDALRAKAVTPPHVLVMTATPIPRTIAMTVFGDMDISTLKERPRGESMIETHVVEAALKPAHLQRAWQRVREEVGLGNQVYIVAPRISSSDDSDFERYGLSAEDLNLAKKLAGDEPGEDKSMVAVEELYEELETGPLKGLRLGILHGRLATDVKQQTMADFASGSIDVLVTTTVIEVGIDVANASMMVIMDADRFGISQLHQLRGRIGRGSAPALCLFVTKSQGDAIDRLKKVAATNDGFELSLIDLEERREGDVLGSAQSGIRSHLRLLRVIRDETLISKAREVAISILERDPQLSSLPILLGEVSKLTEEERANYLEKK